jgi:hypothetical protein
MRKKRRPDISERRSSVRYNKATHEFPPHRIPVLRPPFHLIFRHRRTVEIPVTVLFSRLTSTLDTPRSALNAFLTCFAMAAGHALYQKRRFLHANRLSSI